MKKRKFQINKITSWTTIVFIVANFLSAPLPASAEIKITNEDVERVKNGLDLIKSFVNFTVLEEKINKILNMAIETGEISTDVTYGLLILSSLNEIDLIDSVVSQRYKIEARNYFNGILDERLNLFNYYKGIANDIPKILTQSITGPISALSLKTFSMTSDIIDIFIAFENIKTIKMYDGLWVYFDFRKHNETHHDAWEDAKLVMGWANPNTYWRFREKQREEDIDPIESQFSTLFDKWGPHVTSEGVKEEIKQKAKAELRDSLSFAIKKYELVEEETKPSFWDEAKASLENLWGGIKNTEKKLTAAVSDSQQSIIDWWKYLTGDNQDSAVVSVSAVDTSDNDSLNTESAAVENGDEKVTEGKDPKANTVYEENGGKIQDMQEILDKITEDMDFFSQQIEDFSNKETTTTTEELAEESEEAVEEEETDFQNDSEESEYCKKLPGNYPSRSLVIFNEVAWMGSSESANDEWMELKNISNQKINLQGWQIIDKDEQIKIALEEENYIEPKKFFLLERTDDNSVPWIEADLIYKGGLGNTDEILYLFDENCYLRDEVSAFPDWPAGDNSSKRTMERKFNLEWQTSNTEGGTPRRMNSTGFSESGGSGRGLTSSDDVTPATSKKILITEVQIGDSSSSQHDFIELYNPDNAASVDISGFQLKKRSSSGKEYSVIVFPKNTAIAPENYFLWANYHQGIFPDATTTQSLSRNNSLILFNTEKETIDAVAWGSSTNPFIEGYACSNPGTSQVIGRKWLESTGGYSDTDNNYEDFELQSPTPRAKNKSPVINSNQLPITSFSYEPKEPETGESVVFDASMSSDSDGEIVNFVWDFGEETIVTTTSPTTSHAFSSPGNFAVVLKVVDNNGATSSPASSTLNVLEKYEEMPTLEVAINEISWMGTRSSSFDEWIELYNTTSSDINLNGWILSWNRDDKVSSIIFSTSTGCNTILPGHDFYLIERTDEESVADITADWTGSFGSGLSNEGVKIELRNPEGKLIDFVNCSSGWFAGESSPHYISMERIDANASGTKGNWANNNLITRIGKDAEGNNINGTPKAQNSVSKTQTEIPTSDTLDFDEFDELTLTRLGHPYIVGDMIDVPEGKVLRIEPGVTLKLLRNKLIYIEGSLRAEGKENQEIIFSSESNEPWAGIRFEKDTPNNTVTSCLEFVKIDNAKRCRNLSCSENVILSVDDRSISFRNSILENTAGAEIGTWLIYSSSSLENIDFSNFDTAVDMEGGASEIKDCSFFENYRGLYVRNKSKPHILNNTFESNTRPIYSVYSFPFLAGNTAENNIYNAVSIGGILATTTLYNDLPYVLETGNTTEESILILEPGTVIKLKDQRFEINGKILTPGNNGKPVVFTSLLDDEYGGDTNNDAGATQATSSDWHNLFFRDSGSILQNVIIRYGGSEGSPAWINVGAITLDMDVEIVLKNSLIEKNIHAVSFPTGTSCEEIKETILGFEAQNTVFQDNKYLTYPHCTW